MAGRRRERVWRSGNVSAFQAEAAGSIPASRTALIVDNPPRSERGRHGSIPWWAVAMWRNRSVLAFEAGGLGADPSVATEVVRLVEDTGLNPAARKGQEFDSPSFR